MSAKSKEVKRLARIEGQVRGIVRMLEDDRDCKDVLVEIRAVRAALQAVATVIAEAKVTELISSAMGVANANDEKVAEALKVLKYGS